MSDLRDVLQHRTTTLSLSLRDADEFNLAAATSGVRRKRAIRASLTTGVAAVAVIAIGAGAWAGYGALKQTPATSQTPSATPSGSAAQSASPSATPSESATPVFEGRNPDMSDEEALARAANPATGEVWLAKPKEVTPAAWSRDDFFAGYWGAPRWYLVGHRAGNRILSQGESGYLVEVDSAGTPHLIVAPAPYQEAPTDEVDAPIDVEAEIYYDSLALPASVTTPEGDVLDLRAGVTRVVEQTTFGPEQVDAVAGSLLLRDTGPAYAQAWGADVEAVLAGDVMSTAYFVELPYGALLQPSLSPLRGDIEWSAGYGTIDGSTFTDFFDQTCESSLLYMTSLDAQSAGPWVKAGTVGDRTVLAPTASSALAKAMYANFTDAISSGINPDGGELVTSLDDYIHAPAFVAVTTDDPDVWWLMLNTRLSARYWC